MAVTTSLQQTSMHFNENQQGHAILEKMCAQKELGRFCDITFHVQEQKFEAHRNVLAACSPYFDSVLKMHKTVKEQLTVTCQNAEAFGLLLNYMYTGSVIIDKNNVSELLRLANHFIVGKLKHYCAEYLDRYLDVRNCLSVREMAEKYNVPGLLKNSGIFIQSNIKEILEQEEILNYNFQKIEAFLSDKTWAIPQPHLLAFVARWVNFDIANRKSELRFLLTFINWQTLDHSFIEHNLANEKLYQGNPFCLYIFLSCLEENNIKLYSYQSVYKDLHEKFTNSNVDDDSFISLAVTAAIQGLQPTVVSNAEENICKPVSVPPIDKEEGPKSVPDPEEQSPDGRSNKSNDNSEINNGEKTVTNPERPLSQSIKFKMSSQRRISVIARRRSRRKFGSSFKFPNRSFYKRPVGRPPKRRYVMESDTEDEEDDEKMDDIDEGDESDNSYKGSDDDLSTSNWKEGVKCPHCAYLGHSAIRLEQHISKVHAKDVTYKCKVCDFTCKWNREYYLHMKIHFHGPPFRCERCDYTCDRIQFLLSHRMRHTDERPYKCDECNHRCRTKANLDAHFRCHSGEKPYQCEHCDRRFTIKASLDQHLATHSEDRPFLCDICGFSTKYQSHLLSHKRIHSGDVFRCHFPNCRYSTPKKSQLAAHQRTHTAVRSHICAVCGRGFIEKSHLVRHERIHLNDKPFKCDQCDYCSSRRDKLKEHFRKHHGENATAKGPYRPRKPRKQNFDPVVFPGRNTADENQAHPLSSAQLSISAAPPLQPPLSLPSAAQSHPETQTVMSTEGSNTTVTPMVYTLEAAQQDALHNHAALALQQLGVVAAQKYQMTYFEPRLPQCNQQSVHDQERLNPPPPFQEGSENVNMPDFNPFMSLM